jgi:3-hydroxyisobutyrate dehydrogenase-like beta-hydroxyacid dehydrogenase
MSAVDREPVTLIGLGPMGQAMVRSLLAAGHPVTVWNRTAGRAVDVVAAGAVLAPGPREALATCDLVILSLTDYPAMYSVLAGTEAALQGKTIVNLSSDTPDASREAAAWAAAHGARFLTGGVMVPAPMVGTDSAYVYYSGPAEVLAAHEPALARIGAPRYVGDDPGLAQLYYQAQLTVFLTALSGLLQGTALVASAGVAPGDFVREAMATITDIPLMLRGDGEIATSLTTGDHPGDLSTVAMMGATADHIVGASAATGVDSALPLAIKSQYDRAIAAGHAKDNWTSLYEVLKSPT